jgi:hypothetical protein
MRESSCRRCDIYMSWNWVSSTDGTTLPAQHQCAGTATCHRSLDELSSSMRCSACLACLLALYILRARSSVSATAVAGWPRPHVTSL